MFKPDTRILVVDDMLTMRKIIKKSLTELGLTQVTEAENGAVAWEKVQQSAASQFQLIISDWNMPQMTGIEFLKKVREFPHTKDLPFLLLTAESEKSQVVEAIQAKVSGYLVKPFTTPQILEQLTDISKKMGVA